MLRKYLKKRKAFLRKTLKECGHFLEKAPRGKLRISCPRGSVSYYCRDEGCKGEVRLSKDRDKALIRQLAMKDYYRKLIPVAEKELEYVEGLLSMEENQTLANVISSYHPERRKLLNPVEETREESLNRWIGMPAPPSKPRTGSYYIPTERGEYVRSRNEYMIANALFRAGIPYKYEFPYRAVNDVILHPDFFVRNVSTGQEFFWEHFGMMDNPEYVMKNFLYKVSLFHADGIILGKNLIATFSGGKSELDIQTISDMIDAFLT